MDGPLNQQCWYECPQCDYKNKYPFNLEYHMKSHTRNHRFKCPLLCSFSSNFKFYLERHVELHHVNMPTPPQQGKEIMDTNNKTELVNLRYGHDESEESPISFNIGSSEAAGMNLNKTSIEIEEQKIEFEEADCRKRISQCREDIRKARFSMTEMRGKVRKQKEIRSEEGRQREMLSHCLQMIKINNQKLSDLATETKKLETLRSNIRDVNRRKLQFELELRELQLKDLQSKKHLYESNDDIVVIELNDDAIQSLKSRIKGMKNELNILQEEERVLARDAELRNQNLQVVVEVPDQVQHGIQSEIEELESAIKASLQDDTEDAFNQLIISTGQKINNLFELKNSLFDIMFTKKRIQRMSAFKL